MVDFHKRILFSDEAHFWLNGYVNKQNCRIWSEANPQVYVETPLHPEKLTVCNTKVFGGGTRSSETLSSDENTCELETLLLNIPSRQQKDFYPRLSERASFPLHGGPSVALGFKLMTR
ncbi:hypothetical protein TNCV_1600111 [Trichonephila clavipes]|nr:hypothetical protein TNCV_1600111 [Trichonephila clavipes]